MQLIIRDARSEDATAILPIYNYAALETTAVWNDAPSDLPSREAWLAERQARGFPVLVAEGPEGVLGFASFGDFRPWDGYRHTVENSVYVAPSLHGRGIGRCLVDGLIDRAVEMQKHAMIAAIEASNTASLRLHAAAGFAEVGRLPQVGCKFGRWLDLVLMERRLSEREAPPEVSLGSR